MNITDLETAVSLAQEERSYEDRQLIDRAAQHYLDLLKQRENQKREFIVIANKYEYAKHPTFNMAFKEVNRLSSRLGGKFTILKVKGTVENPQQPTTQGEE